ncbi:MAG: hypothetical protein KBC84_08675, partial [Proteobacteria bacterium]|nr:hypothetical protein [Pseudomonadota bacterium]
EFEAFNDTNLSLVQIILAYPDYPGDIYQDDFSDNRLTLINSANQGLNSILSLHKILGQYIGALKNQDYPLDRLNFEYTLHYLALDKLGEKLDNVARVALQCLTPNLAWALSEMSSQAVATAYLATEAGKCLVFKKEGEHFLRISQHPHLQARAILQSVESYFNDYSYNEREQIRQAVIYSTSVNPEKEILLPLQMTKGAKGLRNCLEILWHLNNNWQSKAKTLELHGHLSDLHHNFCENYLNKISTQHIVGNPHIYGLPYRSLTLVAIDLITECSFINIDEERINRIIQLLNEDEEFKNFEKFLVSSKGKNRLEIQKQIITFAMLKKHNWAANKIGDFYLPQERVIKSIVVGQDTSTSRSLVFGFESLVPLRQSKFQEYFGIDWKEKYFPQAPHHHSVKIFVDQESYQNNLNLEVDLLKAHGKGSAISALRRF